MLSPLPRFHLLPIPGELFSPSKHKPGEESLKRKKKEIFRGRRRRCLEADDDRVEKSASLPPFLKPPPPLLLYSFRRRPSPRPISPSSTWMERERPRAPVCFRGRKLGWGKDEGGEWKGEEEGRERGGEEKSPLFPHATCSCFSSSSSSSTTALEDEDEEESLGTADCICEIRSGRQTSPFLLQS